jgi:hypothetical protein
MGFVLSRDLNIKLYITLKQVFYVAGERVEGAVHILCTADRPYRFLSIIVEGEEETKWAGDEAGTIMHANRLSTYLEESSLTEFEEGLQKGHYSFPFAFLLPGNLPSSMKIDDSNHIKYKVSARLYGPDNSVEDQIFEKSLHVR